jgi:hypothetical protein
MLSNIVGFCAILNLVVRLGMLCWNLTSLYADAARSIVGVYGTGLIYFRDTRSDVDEFRWLRTV